MTNPILDRGRAGRTLIAAALVALPAPALADLTSQQLWDQWQEYLQSFGYEVSADVAPTDGGLTVSDLAVTLPLEAMDGPAGTVRIGMGSFTMTDQGDGTVAVTMPQTSPMTVEATPEDGEAVRVGLTYTSPDFRMTASGTPTETRYDYGASVITLALSGLNVDGEAMDLGTVEVSMNDLTGMSALSIGDAFGMRQEMAAGSIGYTVDNRNPEPGGSGTFKLSGELNTVSSTGGGTIPKNVDMNDMVAALNAGYVVDVAMTYASGMLDMAFAEGAETFAYRSSSSGGRLDVALGASGLSYGISGTGMKMHVEGSDMPFSANLSAEEAGLRIAMPVMSGDAEQDFSAGLTLAGITVPDPIWAMADPGGALPHDPLTLRLDLSGKGQLMVDLFDEAQMAQLGATGGVPGMVNSLKLETLQLKAAGAEISASADLDVDNQAMSPLGPFPNVFGTADVRVVNLLELSRTLTQMGLLPQGQAMMISGMLQQLGEPVSGPDDLKAHIELTEQGALSVNGNPMPLQ